MLQGRVRGAGHYRLGHCETHIRCLRSVGSVLSQMHANASVFVRPFENIKGSYPLNYFYRQKTLNRFTCK